MGLRLGRAAREWGLELAGAWPAERAVDGGSVRLSSLSVAWVPCGRVGWLRACGVARAGLVVAAGSGLEPARRGLSALAVIGARLAVQVPLSPRVGLELQGELGASLVRTALRVGEAVAWRTPRLGGAAALALVWRLR
ncbi:MAG: hypothetical protein H6746_12140 [Deltaproteobacteria bacterium]|nr:hypothetical protein [Deltaproteobacteria bacterium]